MKKLFAFLGLLIIVCYAAVSEAGINFTMPPCGADLTITSMSITPATPTCRDTVKVNITIRNIGDANAGASITRILLDNVAVQNLPTSSLTPGQSIAFTNISIGKPSIGTHTVTGVCDATNLVAEDNETNNTY
jgi:subtilase family serine protease